MKPYLALTLALCLTGCEQAAVMMTAKNQAQASHSDLAKHAEAVFWKTLHQGRYQDIPRADKLLMAAYLENPNDPHLAAHIGFLHIWKLAERQRISGYQRDPLITNEILLAKHYFQAALDLEPNNPIFKGFLGDVLLIEGQVFRNKRTEVKGYFTLKQAIAEWPAFNYFTAGYPMSTLPANSPHFQEGLDWQWKTLDVCAGQPINRQHPDFSAAMKRETTQGPLRACWNSGIAPYNFEGFFMNMGDMLVKSGDWKTGVLIYQNAKLDKHYASWPYRDLLEKRIKHAKANSRLFQNNNQAPSRSIMFNSGAGCMACHRR